MTNINCSSNCIYQKDGKCSYHFVSPSSFSSFSKCAYFVPAENVPFSQTSLSHKNKSGH